MELVQTLFDCVKVIRPKVFGDDRGFFQESFNKKSLEKIGITHEWIQDNHSYSAKKGTIRGIHFQRMPMQQNKLVRVIKGQIIDYIVDLRQGSPTFGQYKEVQISDQNHYQVLVPAGMGHAFCTMTDDCHVFYKVDNYYSAECNDGILWNDPDIAIQWPTQTPILSLQDQKWELLKDKKNLFPYANQKRSAEL